MEATSAAVNVHSAMPFLGVLAALLAVLLVLGRTLVGALRFRPLLRFTPLNAAGSAVVGLAALTVAYAWLTAAGLSARAVAALVPLLALSLAFVGRRTWPALLRPRGPLVHWLAVAAIAATAGVLGLLPVLRGASFAVDNDVHTYCALSEWLQEHGFHSPAAWDPESPATYFPELWQRTGDPLGAVFPLALVQVASRAPSSLAAYPPTAAAGLALAALAVAFLARRALRLSVAASLLAGWLLALVPSPVHWGHHEGFLQQTLALPALLVSLALLGRPGGLVRARSSSAWLLAGLLAFLVLVYLPFVPLFLAAALAPALLVARRAAGAARGRSFLLWLGLAALLALALSMGALVRAPRRIGTMTGAVPGVHIDLTLGGFAETALGARLPGWGPSVVWPVLLALALAGLPRLVRPPRAGSVLGALALLVAALAYFALVAKDPWTHATGHTWSVFKLIQWGYPLVLLAEVSGLAWLLGRAKGNERAGLLAAGLLALAWLPSYWSWSGDLGRSLQRLFGSPRPLDTLRAAKEELRTLPGGPLLVVNRPADVDPWLGIYGALLAYPRPIVADWEGSVDIRADRGPEPWRARLRELGDDRGPAPVVLGPSTDARGLRALGGGFALLPDLEPRLLQIRNPDDLRGLEDRPPFYLGRGRTKLAIFSGSARAVEVVAELEGRRPAAVVVAVLGPALAGQSWRTAVQGASERPVPLAPDRTLRLPLDLEPGLTRIVLRAPDAEDPRATRLGGVLVAVR
jgi:hypothetical protein